MTYLIPLLLTPKPAVAAEVRPPAACEAALDELERIGRRLHEETQSVIEAHKARAVAQGEIIPEDLLKIADGSRVQFNDGASFRVARARRLTGDFVSFDILQTNLMDLSPVDRLELVVSAWSSSDPTLQIISSGALASSSPRENMKYHRAQMNELHEILPLRRYHKISADGAYGVADAVATSDGEVLTFGRYLEALELTRGQRVEMADALEEFLRDARVNFQTLNLSNALAYDPRDKKWRLLVIDHQMRRWVGDHLADKLVTAMVGTLTADPEFFIDLGKRLDRLGRQIAREDAAESARAQREQDAKYVPLAGIYEFHLPLEGDARRFLSGTLDLSSLARARRENLLIRVNLLDAEDKVLGTYASARSNHDLTERDGLTFIAFNQWFDADLNVKPGWMRVPLSPVGALPTNVEVREITFDTTSGRPVEGRVLGSARMIRR